MISIIEIGEKKKNILLYKVTVCYTVEMYQHFFIYAMTEDEMLDLLAEYYVENNYVSLYMLSKDMENFIIESNGTKSEHQIMQDWNLRLCKTKNIYVRIDEVECFDDKEAVFIMNKIFQKALIERYVDSKGLITENDVGATTFSKWMSYMNELYSHALAINKQIKDNPTELNEFLCKDAVWDIIHQIYHEIIGQVNNHILPKNTDLEWLISAYAINKNKTDADIVLSPIEAFRLKFECFLAREILVQRNKPTRILEDEVLDHKVVRNMKARVRKNRRRIQMQSDTEEKSKVQTKMIAYSDDILYIYKGNIRCHRDAHSIIQSTAVLHNKTDNEIELNVEYCKECKKFILEYTLFEQYRNRYGALIGNFRIAANGEFNGEYDLAEESPLMLSGYNVGQKDGYTSRERHYILARIIHDGIMDKGDVIRYLSYFIRKNGAKRGNEIALSKWEEDLAFVQGYKKSIQPRAIISDIKKY